MAECLAGGVPDHYQKAIKSMTSGADEAWSPPRRKARSEGKHVTSVKPVQPVTSVKPGKHVTSVSTKPGLTVLLSWRVSEGR